MRPPLARVLSICFVMVLTANSTSLEVSWPCFNESFSMSSDLVMMAPLVRTHVSNLTLAFRRLGNNQASCEARHIKLLINCYCYFPFVLLTGHPNWCRRWRRTGCNPRVSWFFCWFFWFCLFGCCCVFCVCCFCFWF